MIIKNFRKFISESMKSGDTLIIVDVQKSFRKYFTEMYLHELENYCENFEKVYQIFDNHVDGKNPDSDYLIDDSPEIPINGDLYTFPNQVDLIEKRYNYDVDADFYKKVLDRKVWEEIKQRERDGKLKKGDTFRTKLGTIITYIGNKHKWFHCPKKLSNLLEDLRGKNVVITGGADSECLNDVYTTAEALGVKIRRDWKYIWSASHCPIK